MKAEDRRREIALFLTGQKKPISGATLSKQFNVSRQIIVQDIALLKAMGYEVVSTHYGYFISSSPTVERIFKIYHTSQQTKEELSLIVSLGGTVVDVFVWHKVFGKVEAKLNIFSPYQVDKFIEGVTSGTSRELMQITGGFHYHTVRADSVEVLDKIEQALLDKGFLANEI